MQDNLNKNRSLIDFSLLELSEAIKQLGEPAFRAKQVYSWLLKGSEIEDMANIPKKFRDKLNEEYVTGLPKIRKRQVSRLDNSEKFLYEFDDKALVEGVLMKYSYGNTLCISSQVGCRMGCTFCASTKGGLLRNLSDGEMLGEVIAVRSDKNSEEAVKNIVMMGSGEPFDNYDNVLKFIRRMCAEDGFNFSPRRISISTCGIPKYIVKLAEDAPGVNLSISLHAHSDDLRRTMMPIAKKYLIRELISAAKEHVKISGRRVTFEYALIDGVNDEIEDAAELARILRGFQCHVNLIPLNPIVEEGKKGSSRKKAHDFAQELESLGISASVRRELGSDIDGACGQLRAKFLDE